jgi:endonuclease YncB( thermonuclease family)
MPRIGLPSAAGLAGLVLQSMVLAAEEPSGDGTWQVLTNCELASGSGFENGCLQVVQGGETRRFRLYFVDPPAGEGDAEGRREDQERYFQTGGATLAEEAVAASQAARRFLHGRFEVVTRWQDARGEGAGAPAAYAFLRQNGRHLSTALVEAGLARVYGLPPAGPWPGGMPPEDFLRELKGSERRAQSAGAGIWAHAAASPQLAGRDLALPGGGPTPAGPLVDLNTASAAELASLPGIGPALAERIVRARPIRSLEGLTDIPGISAGTVDGFRGRIVPLGIVRHRLNK